MDPKDLEFDAVMLLNFDAFEWDNLDPKDKIRREKEAERLLNKASMLKLEQTGRIY